MSLDKVPRKVTSRNHFFLFLKNIQCHVTANMTANMSMKRCDSYKPCSSRDLKVATFTSFNEHLNVTVVCLVFLVHSHNAILGCSRIDSLYR